MQKPNTLLFILALVVLALFLPEGCIAGIAGLVWQISKVVLILFAIIIIIAYFRKRND
jgi:formate hydrogenlyase subunit 4